MFTTAAWLQVTCVKTMQHIHYDYFNIVTTLCFLKSHFSILTVYSCIDTKASHFTIATCMVSNMVIISPNHPPLVTTTHMVAAYIHNYIHDSTLIIV